MRRLTRQILPVLFLFLSSQAYSQFSKQIYEAPNLKEIASTHKKVAIIPFHVSITWRHPPKGFSNDANKADERKLETGVQSSLYTFLMRKRERYSVDFQEPELSNRLLAKAHISDMDTLSYDNLCKLLNVDAILSGDYKIEHTKSETAAIVGYVLVGALASNDKTGNLTLTIHEGKKGELIWRFAKELQGSFFVSTDQVIEHMMRKVSRNFPYEK